MPKLTHSRMDVIGIDPGKSGGIAVLTSTGSVRYLSKMMDTDKDLLELLDKYRMDSIVFLEKVHAGPKMGSSAAFKFGRGYGAIVMAVLAVGVRLEIITPQAWQKKLGLLVSGRGLGQGDSDKKNRNKAKAQEIFPEAKITHATADALLIAEYGRQVLNGR